MKFSTIATLLSTSAGVLAGPSATAKKATAIESIKGDNGITTPLPIQPGMVDDCDAFYYVKPGDNCLIISAQFGISFDQFKEWNPTVGKDCLSLWADANVCVRTIGFKYPEIAACYVSEDILPWGNNKPDARRAAAEWCQKGANGIYNIGEKRSKCVDAPSGDGKFIFEIYNEWGIRQAILPTECRKNLVLPIDGCPEGGQGRVKSWHMETTLEKGKC
ncbi:uncharacterized protein BKA55DRAFT_638736 [Fusarium redolens]|uniref:LysM domain-containing protein n=1 Tax=Fusarium redolens TaxID=48865 RepID=A0A9P9HKE4_FUSRE|nr:uncharacterized protein BKA55DRAFT_638736 [Fusarium redolens]KAH7259021.1 hypothetical protein BKA55DRAFT_638736 [Fusarium redolens]